MIAIPVPTEKPTYYDVRLQSTHAVHAFLEVEHPSGMSLVMTHLGQSTIIDENGTKFRFSTPPLQLNFEYNDRYEPLTIIQNDTDFEYIKYSPYGLWQVDIRPGVLPGLTDIKGISLLFQVSYTAHDNRGEEEVSVFGKKGGRSCIAVEVCLVCILFR